MVYDYNNKYMKKIVLTKLILKKIIYFFIWSGTETDFNFLPDHLSIIVIKKKKQFLLHYFHFNKWNDWIMTQTQSNKNTTEKKQNLEQNN